MPDSNCVDNTLNTDESSRRTLIELKHSHLLERRFCGLG